MPMTKTLTFLLMLLFATTAFPHHGFGTFDLQGEVELQGTITGVDFVNPHAWVYLDVVNNQGQVESWRCEMRAATVLRRSGWTKELFVEGESIFITGAPDTRDSRSCYLSLVVFSDGSSAERYGQLRESTPIEDFSSRKLRLANGDLNISGDWAPEQFVMEDPQGRQGRLVPLSLAEDAPGDAPFSPWGSSRVTFTEEGRQVVESFDTRSPEDNPRMRCEITSIIFDWDFDGPVNRIVQEDNVIVMQYGRHSFNRLIHMDLEQHPENLEPSRSGHSIGRWESDVLVVDTVGFLPGMLSPPVPNSRMLHVEERFTFDTESMTLTRHFEATDPVYYEDTYLGSDTMKMADLTYGPDECKELTFVDFDQQ